MAEVRSPEQATAVYRRFVRHKSRTCVACQVKRPGKDLADVFEFDNVCVAVCRFCRPTTGPQQAYQLSVFGTPRSSGLYWMIGPQAPPNHAKDPPRIKEEEKERYSLKELDISTEEWEAFERAEYQQQEAQRKQQGRYR